VFNARIKRHPLVKRMPLKFYCLMVARARSHCDGCKPCGCGRQTDLDVQTPAEGPGVLTIIDVPDPAAAAIAEIVVESWQASFVARISHPAETDNVTPGPLAPARELYGAMLLDRGKANEALTAYEAVLKKEPNRLAAYVGATKNAYAVGDQAKVREYAAQIARLTADADASRPELIEIRETTGTKL
jgi:hypothetical protein